MRTALANGLRLGALAVLTAVAGCSGSGYVARSVEGHLSLLNSARPVSEWIADSATPTDLRERLLLSQRIRDFAVSELKLPDNASYRRYADLHRSAAVWNVVATPELSLSLKTWCFPVTGCIGYRGYFELAQAREEATELRAQGLEVSVYPVPAYSTLGKLPGNFFADPLLNTFIRWPEGELARLIFHELAHQVAYARDDTAFNESFATAVERLGGKRWLDEHASAQAREEYAQFDARRVQFRALTLSARGRLDAIYRSSASEADKRAGKERAFQELRADYEQLKSQQWGGYAGYDPWVANANNASLAVQAAYDDWVPAFTRLFEKEGRDWTRFYARVKELAQMPPEERHAALRDQISDARAR